MTNWSDEEFSISWKDETGDNIYTLKAGEVKTYPQYLAFYITKNFVDREMYKIAEKETEARSRERLGMAVSNKDLRKPYEDKTMQEVKAGEESPEVVAMRAQIRREVQAEQGLSSEIPSNNKAPSVEEFAGLTDPIAAVPVAAPVKEPVKNEAPLA